MQESGVEGLEGFVMYGYGISDLGVPHWGVGAVVIM